MKLLIVDSSTVARRQLFVPLQLLADQGCASEDVFAGKQTPKLRAAFERLSEEAWKHLDTAFALLATVQPEVRRVFLPLAQTRRELEGMSRADYDPFVPQATSRFRILWTLWRASRSRAFRA